MIDIVMVNPLISFFVVFPVMSSLSFVHFITGVMNPVELISHQIKTVSFSVVIAVVFLSQIGSLS